MSTPAAIQPKPIYQCCFERFDNHHKFWEHITRSANHLYGVKYFKLETICNLCCELFENTDSLVAHLRTNSHLDKLLPEPYACSCLEEPLNDQKEVEAHITEASHRNCIRLQGIVARVLCGPCHRIFITDKSLKAHFKSEEHLERIKALSP